MRPLVLLFICLFAFQTFAQDDDFSSDLYQSLSRSDKMAKLWSRITTDETELGYYSPVILATIFLESMDPTFDWSSDTFPLLRKKLIHTVGVIAQGEMVIDPASPYTGILEGADNVLIRLSAAKGPDYTKTTADGANDNFTPGMSLKFLRDGLPSGNLLAMYGVNGFPSWNFFFKDFSNHIPTATGVPLKALSCKFAQATNYIQEIGLSELASWSQLGEDRRSEINFPFQLVFKPTSQVKNLFPDDFVQKFTDQLKTIRAGTSIYDVYAIANPGESEVKIGTLRTKTDFVSSYWGDESLFFQHTKMDDDLAIHPEWTSQTPAFSLLSAVLH